MAELQVQTKPSETLKIWNLTRAKISIDITQYPTGGADFPTNHQYVELPPLSIAPTVLEDPAIVKAVKAHKYFQNLEATGAVRVDKAPGMGAEIRSASEPVPPPDMKKPLGSKLGQVHGMEMPLDVAKREKVAS